MELWEVVSLLWGRCINLGDVVVELGEIVLQVRNKRD